MAATQTTTIETVSVVRPLKNIGRGSFRTGLFLECTASSEPSHAAPLREAPLPGKCHAPARDSGQCLFSQNLHK
uniref:Uncharacterized protein n=1 Tax=Angiostrongylus cantonensis TaxID=6313 RepID=A0A0K0DNY2_ANGCA